MSIPEKCRNCFKFYNKTVVYSCDICDKLQFPEENLCDLLRFNEKEFDCGSYKPKLQLVSGKTKSNNQLEIRSTDDDYQRKKWTQSFLVQQQKQNPDQIKFKLRYHMILITRDRSAILAGKYFKSFSTIFENAAKSFYDTTIDLMWVSSDHVHLRLDSSPDFSVDEIFQAVLDQSERVIYMKHPELKPKDQKLWENSYYVETLG